MKMTSVIPVAATLQGVGQYTAEEMLYGLSWVGATDDDILMGLQGIGAAVLFRTPVASPAAPAAPAAKPSVMNAIIANAKEMTKKQAVMATVRATVAKKDPTFAIRLAAVAKKTAQPGTNVAKGVVAAAQEAAKKATAAKVQEKNAKKLLNAGDKRGAAAQAVNALTTAREAATLANRAEKTRLTSSLDSVANTLESQARYIDNVLYTEIARSGGNARTDAMRANAEHLRSQAKNLRAESAVIAVAPTVPANAPTVKRIAEVANKFNIRTAGHEASSKNRAMVSVLSDLAAEPMAQAQDYEGARMYYGNDSVGGLMADIEFDNYSAAAATLSEGLDGIGYVETLPAFAQADRALQQGVTAAQQGFVNAVLPAYMGQSPQLQMVQQEVQSLGGLGQHRTVLFEDPVKGAARIAKFDQWCRDNYAGNDEYINKCMNPSMAPFCPDSQPWEVFGKICRGTTDFAGAIGQIGRAITSGQVKLPDLPGVAAPPANTRPPTTVPAQMWQPQQPSTMAAGAGYGGAIRGAAQDAIQALRTGKIPPVVMYAGIGLGVLALGTAVYLTMFRKPTA